MIDLLLPFQLLAMANEQSPYKIYVNTQNASKLNWIPRPKNTNSLHFREHAENYILELEQCECNISMSIVIIIMGCVCLISNDRKSTQKRGTRERERDGRPAYPTLNLCVAFYVINAIVR